MRNPKTTWAGIIVLIAGLVLMGLGWGGVIDADAANVLAGISGLLAVVGLLSPDRPGNTLGPVVALAGSAMLTVGGVGCKADDSARAYLIASATHTQAVETAGDLIEWGLIDRDEAVRFRADAERSRAILDRWHAALIEGRSFDSSLVFDLVDELIVWTMQREAENESGNDRDRVGTGPGSGEADRADRPGGQWRPARHEGGARSGEGHAGRGARSAGPAHRRNAERLMAAGL